MATRGASKRNQASRLSEAKESSKKNKSDRSDRKSKSEMEIMDSLDFNSESPREEQSHVSCLETESGADPVLDMFQRIEETFKKDGKMSEEDFQRAFFGIFRIMYGRIQKENSVLREEVTLLKTRVQQLEDYKYHGACEEAKRGVLVWNLAPVVDEGSSNESHESLRKYVSKIMAATETDGEGEPMIRRLPPSRMALKKAQDTKTEVKRPVLLRFNTAGQKFRFLKGLPNAHLREERFSQEFPFHLKEKAKMLESVAFSLRQKSEGTKTRVAWEGDQLILKAKKKGETEFKEVPRSTWPTQ